MGLENVDVVVVAGVQGGVGGQLPEGFVALDPSGLPYVVTIVAIEDRGAGLVVRLPINPESWERSYAQSWAARGAALARADKQDWQGNTPAPLRFSVTLQGDDARLLEAQTLKPLEGLRDRIQPSTQEPPPAIITFGAHQYRVVLNEITIRRLRTDANGDATLAEVTVSATDQAK